MDHGKKRWLGSLDGFYNRAAMLCCNNTLLVRETFIMPCSSTGLSHCRTSKTFVLGLMSHAVQGGTWHPDTKFPKSCSLGEQNLDFRDKPGKCNYTHCSKCVLFLSSANNMPIFIFSESGFPLYLVISSPFFTGKKSVEIQIFHKL